MLPFLDSTGKFTHALGVGGFSLGILRLKTAASATGTFQTSQSYQSSLKSATYDYAIWNFLRLICFNLVSLDFAGARGTATRPSADHGRIAHRNCVLVFVCDADSIANTAPTHRCTFSRI